MKYEIQLVHIDTIKQNDTVMIDGEMKTVGNHHIKKYGFMGTTLFGDNYRSGTIPVEKVIIYRAIANGQLAVSL